MLLEVIIDLISRVDLGLSFADSWDKIFSIRELQKTITPISKGTLDSRSFDSSWA